MKRILMSIYIIGYWLFSGQYTVYGAEGASSHYFPGFAGTFAVAVAPEPGPIFVNTTLFYGATADQAALQGRVNVGIDAFAVYDLLTGLYVFQKPVLGARFAVGGFLPVAYAELDARASAAIGSLRISGDDFNIGDLGLIPASFYWNTGNFHVKFTELIMAPSGHYDTDDIISVGRNYWSFDTSVAATWFNTSTGTEVSVVPGLMFNTRNGKTKYTTGDEFHLDFMLNQFLAQHFALGFHGYYYTQTSGDSGSGATLGSFKGESVGVGPAILWAPEWGGGKLSVSGKWLHDLDADNRLDGDYGVLNIAYKF